MYFNEVRKRFGEPYSSLNESEWASRVLAGSVRIATESKISFNRDPMSFERVECV